MMMASRLDYPLVYLLPISLYIRRRDVHAFYSTKQGILPHKSDPVRNRYPETVRLYGVHNPGWQRNT